MSIFNEILLNKIDTYYLKKNYYKYIIKNNNINIGNHIMAFLNSFLYILHFH